MSGSDDVGNLTVPCPACGSHEWKAIEVIHTVTPCTLVRSEAGIDIEFDGRAEFTREASTSAVLNYMCADEDCAYVVDPADLGKLVAR